MDFRPAKLEALRAKRSCRLYKVKGDSHTSIPTDRPASSNGRALNTLNSFERKMEEI